jgi:hypothetical protein
MISRCAQESALSKYHADLLVIGRQADGRWMSGHLLGVLEGSFFIAWIFIAAMLRARGTLRPPSWSIDTAAAEEELAQFTAHVDEIDPSQVGVWMR